ncbi:MULTISPECIES: SsrA-binding protein SmpB [Anaerococcus]|uniref:SsrA-binding protein n=2 Tax=Anaerococcus vaginalis TaxID=33037 RepID=C7HU90_9FIRM|nr:MULTISPECIES: SsrA-binding protein SmpB [Anaerococcus]EEU12658.1 SsrA-binding protein [Anaerococcus vaginalis ATCC 51170]MBS4888571.1 SsrA-binding protein SmpB [Anaerococcus vaginalis]MDU5085455.1 SsrA-binding protein SmpB [Anaerococcus vaginalis]MDU5460400.1 SsrA-binding protein SmpB [Anaerococcus vaginalis]MDU6547829.1 SsrA-binding protein SmpB [Anaerococcus vaginalis]
MKILANNKKAKHDYFLEEKYEAGIELKGNEVKSIREGKVSIKESHVGDYKGELFIYNMNVTPYEQSYEKNIDPIRTRKLLLHKKEIDKLIGKVSQAGYTMIVNKIYLKEGLIKAEIALAKGKKIYDKRETIKKNDAKRKIERALKNY